MSHCTWHYRALRVCLTVLYRMWHITYTPHMLYTFHSCLK